MKTITDFKEMKKHNEPITMLTAYDYYSAQIAQESGVDIILVGDSMGNVVQGRDSTIGVSMKDIIYHSEIVRRGAPDTFLLADMPYKSYHLDIYSAKKNALDIMIKTRANAVKIEGGSHSRIEVMKAFVDCEIPVCAHLGLTPQSVNMLGEFKVQAKKTDAQWTLIEQAVEIEKAGAFMLVVECVPELVGQKLRQTLKIPVIGIGAGRHTDGQVLVWHDMLGITDNTPKFVKRYSNLKQILTQAVSLYVSETRGKQFPDRENVYYPLDK